MTTQQFIKIVALARELKHKFELSREQARQFIPYFLPNGSAAKP